MRRNPQRHAPLKPRTPTPRRDHSCNGHSHTGRRRECRAEQGMELTTTNTRTPCQSATPTPAQPAKWQLPASARKYRRRASRSGRRSGSGEHWHHERPFCNDQRSLAQPAVARSLMSPCSETLLHRPCPSCRFPSRDVAAIIREVFKGFLDDNPEYNQELGNSIAREIRGRLKGEALASFVGCLRRVGLSGLGPMLHRFQLLPLIANAPVVVFQNWNFHGTSSWCKLSLAKTAVKAYGWALAASGTRRRTAWRTSR